MILRRPFSILIWVPAFRKRCVIYNKNSQRECKIKWSKFSENLSSIPITKWNCSWDNPSYLKIGNVRLPQSRKYRSSSSQSKNTMNWIGLRDQSFWEKNLEYNPNQIILHPPFWVRSHEFDWPPWRIRDFQSWGKIEFDPKCYCMGGQTTPLNLRTWKDLQC